MFRPIPRQLHSESEGRPPVRTTGEDTRPTVCGRCAVQLLLGARGAVCSRMLPLCVRPGLAFVHGCGIAHLDLKCDNIFVVVNGDSVSAQLIDFGSALTFPNRHRDPLVIKRSRRIMTPEVPLELPRCLDLP